QRVCLSNQVHQRCAASCLREPLHGLIGTLSSCLRTGHGLSKIVYELTSIFHLRCQGSAIIRTYLNERIELSRKSVPLVQPKVVSLKFLLHLRQTAKLIILKSILLTSLLIIAKRFNRVLSGLLRKIITRNHYGPYLILHPL